MSCTGLLTDGNFTPAHAASHLALLVNALLPTVSIYFSILLNPITGGHNFLDVEQMLRTAVIFLEIACANPLTCCRSAAVAIKK